MATELPYTMRQLKALIANGRSLSLHELRVMLSLIAFADGDGECFPSNEKIGEPWGMTESNVRAAVRKLKAASPDRPALVESTGAGGVSKSGKGIASLRRLLLTDETRSDLSRVESSRLDSNPVRIDTATRSESGREPGQNLTAKETIEETKEDISFAGAKVGVMKSSSEATQVLPADGRWVASDWDSERSKLQKFEPILAAYPRPTVGKGAVMALRRIQSLANVLIAHHADWLKENGTSATEYLELRTEDYAKAMAPLIEQRGVEKVIPVPFRWFEAKGPLFENAKWLAGEPKCPMH